MWLIEVLTGMIASTYKDDPSTAGLVLAKLDGGTYYASLVRYRQSLGKAKFVVCKAHGATLEQAVQALANGWCGATGQAVPKPPEPPETVVPMRARRPTDPAPPKPEPEYKDRFELLELE